ncbi:hypothetical protein [Bacteroides congonensis]|uniref:hypothetical protein n=1 Tax=Bacteroides congonensis TaxID=1871006 RepID=UPI0026601B20|nr:hypothetical protein [Bacteroides congonensis]
MRVFAAYCAAMARETDRDIAYRCYVTDTLKAILSRLGTELHTRYYDTLRLRPEETRTADEIISNITDKLRELQEEDKN